MKRLVVLLALMLTGCAAQKPARAPQFLVSANCVSGFQPPSQCKAISSELVRCDGVILKIKCVKAAK